MPARFKAFVHRYGRFAGHDAQSATHVGLLVCRCADDAIVGTYLRFFTFLSHDEIEALELAGQLA